jgi:hypothetical protein
VRCPSCRVSEVTSIGLRMAGRPMTMHSCPDCELRWWNDSDGQLVQLGEVLALAARDGRRRRRSEDLVRA